jgi:hypothetical protein
MLCFWLLVEVNEQEWNGVFVCVFFFLTGFSVVSNIHRTCQMQVGTNTIQYSPSSQRALIQLWTELYFAPFF